MKTPMIYIKFFYPKREFIFLFVILSGVTTYAQKTGYKAEITSFRIPLPSAVNLIKHVDLDNDGDPDLLYSETINGIPILWIDDDDDMKWDDIEGDLDSDCLLIDKNNDGIFCGEYDLAIDYGDENKDGLADIQVFVDNGPISAKGFGPGHYMILIDMDNDQVFNYFDWNTFHVDCWEHGGLSNFFTDYSGKSLFLKIHTSTFNMKDLRKNWENPFLFFDPDDDKLTEYAIRLLDNPDIELDKEEGGDEYSDEYSGNVRLKGSIDWTSFSIDIDNDNVPGNEFDYDMTIHFSGKGFRYDKYEHTFNSLAGLEGTEHFFIDPRWRKNTKLLYPGHDIAYNLVFNEGDWQYCSFIFDEDDDCNRWERVEIYAPGNLYKIGQGNKGIDSPRQSDASGDRAEFDLDNSGNGRLYVGKFDGRIHLYGAEWGAWRIDQWAKSYQGFGGIYDGTGLRSQKEPSSFPTIKYEDSNNNGFIDKILYDLNGDTVFEEIVNLLDLNIKDEAPVINTGDFTYEDYKNLFKGIADSLWFRADQARKIAIKYGLNTGWYSKLYQPLSLQQKYHNGFWISFYIYRDLLNYAMLKNDEQLKFLIQKAYYSGNWNLLGQ